MTSNTFEIEQSAQALYQNILERARTGYAVDTGCAVSINSGTLGQTDTLSVATGDIYFNGDVVSVSSQNVQIDSSDSNPRKDVVYLDGTGAVQVAKGTPQSTPDGQNATRFQYFTPVPPSLASTDSVVLAEVWVSAGTSSLGTNDVGDRRAYGNSESFAGVTAVTANYTASSREFVLADASTGAVTVTLPPPEKGVEVGVEKSDTSSNTVTISPNGTENVNYQASEDLAAQGESLDLVSDGTDWFVL